MITVDTVVFKVLLSLISRVIISILIKHAHHFPCLLYVVFLVTSGPIVISIV
jgi:hypothetical protein